MYLNKKILRLALITVAFAMLYMFFWGASQSNSSLPKVLAGTFLLCTVVSGLFTLNVYRKEREEEDRNKTR